MARYKLLSQFFNRDIVTIRVTRRTIDIYDSYFYYVVFKPSPIDEHRIRYEYFIRILPLYWDKYWFDLVCTSYYNVYAKDCELHIIKKVNQYEGERIKILYNTDHVLYWVRRAIELLSRVNNDIAKLYVRNLKRYLELRK